MSGHRKNGEAVADALASEAARHDLAGDRYEAMGDAANARLSRQHAVALRAAADAYQRRTARMQSLREAIMAPPAPPPAPAWPGPSKDSAAPNGRQIDPTTAGAGK